MRQPSSPRSSPPLWRQSTHRSHADALPRSRRHTDRAHRPSGLRLENQRLDSTAQEYGSCSSVSLVRGRVSLDVQASKVRVQDCAGFVAESGPRLRQNVDGELDFSQRRTASAGSPLAGLSGLGELWFGFFHSAAVQLFSIQVLISSITVSSGPVVLLFRSFSTMLIPGNSERIRSAKLAAMRLASCWVQSLP